MNSSIVSLVLVVLAGAAAASFAWPMKHFNGWRWEHVWVGQAITSNVLFPFLAFALYWPALGPFEARVSWSREVAIFLLGVAWGLGGVGYGLSLVLLGLSFTYTILLTATTIVGAILPLFLSSLNRPLHPLCFGLGLVWCVGGTILIGRAAAFQDKNTAGRIARMSRLPMPVPKLTFRAAAMIAVIGGVFSASMGLAMALNADLMTPLLRSKVPPAIAPLMVWVPLNLGSALVSLGYGLWCAKRSKALHLFYRAHPWSNWGLVGAMGLLGFGSLLMYGFGTNAHAHLSENILWAAYMASFILMGNGIGWLSGEWKDCPRRAQFELSLGIGLLLAAIVTLSAA